MCGFAGWFDVAADAGPPPSEARRRRTLDLLRPRGPDDEGEWIAPDGRAGLLHRRLAIVDRAGGAQPWLGPGAGQALAWNGELFEATARRTALEEDGRVLRSRSDTEVLAHLLASGGVTALDREPGQWALAWIDLSDGQQGSLTLARDVVGEKPLYVAEAAGRVAFASTLDALRALVPIDSEIDADALSLYLSWGFIPAPHTIFRGVRKVAAGERLEWRRGAAEPRRLPPAEGPRAPEPHADGVAALRGALTRASRRRLEHSDEPVGVFLSGGLDSLAVASVLRGHPGLRTFTVRATDARYDESAAAARSAAALGVAHTVIEPPSARPDAWRDVLLRHGEPFGSGSALAVDAVARAAAAAGIRVALTGDGGDEALGGYPRHQLLLRLARFPSLPQWMAPRGRGRGRRVRRLAQLLASSPADRYAAMYEVFGPHRSALVPGDDGRAARDRIAGLWRDSAAGDLSAMLRVDRALELADSHCVKVDVACMAHGVEARAPWLDRDVVAVCDALPESLHVAGRVSKVVLRRMLREDLPEEAARDALARPKRGFTSGVDAALAAPEAVDLLTGGALSRLPGIELAAIAGLVADHRVGRGNHRFRLAVLLGLAVFAEEHVR